MNWQALVLLVDFDWMPFERLDSLRGCIEQLVCEVRESARCS